ncbi:MAG TPA: BTAD domain-containing putative transcriptional regulator [Gemmatimonadales bacterium]|nr:BTAD domain-containing putative transcriptional regulator [Gemmatimonadales bacterium]
MLRCRTLGALELTDSTGREHTSVLSQPKRVALLVYLAVAAPRGFLRRDTLLALFWPELDQEHARAALRQALTFLRHELGEEVIRTRGAEEVGIDPERLQCDVTDFDEGLRADNPERALELYRGDFLTGFHVSECGEVERWLDERRRQLRDRAADAASRLADQAEAVGSATETVRWVRRVLELRPENEQALRKLLVILDRGGDRATALREYEAFAERLAAEYQAEPSPETRDIVSGIRTRRGPPRTGAEPVPKRPDRAARVTATIRPSMSLRKTRFFALAPIVAVGLASAAYTAMRFAGIDPLNEFKTTRTTARRNLLVVADFENRTADSALGHTVTEALRIDLGQSPALKLLDGEAVAAVLGRMERDAASPLNPAMAREIAEREGAKAYVIGEIAPLGVGFVLSARVVSAATGDVVAPLRETAADETQLIRAVDQLSAKLRAGLGESLGTIRRSKPLERVTTGSLDALRRYSQAQPMFARGDYAQAILLLEEAIALDSTFAMAYRALAPALANTGGGRSQVVAAARKAFQYRDRLPPRERYLTEASFYDIAQPDQDKEIAAFRRVLEMDADDVIALANLGERYHNTRRYGASEGMYRRVTALRDIAVAYRFLISAQVAQGKFAAAETTLARFTERLPGSPDALAARARYSATLGDFDAAVTRYDSLLQAEQRTHWRIAALNGLSKVALVHGRLVEAERYRREAMTANEDRGVLGGYLVDAVYLATMDLQHRADPDRALREVEVALRSHPLSNILASDRPYVQLAGFYARAGRVSLARRLLAEFEREVHPIPPGHLAGKHYVTGAIALSEGRLQDAVAAFRSYRDHASSQLAGLQELAETFDRLGETDSAIADYERFAMTPAFGLNDEQAQHLGPTYQRLGELHDQRGNGDKARDAYNKLVALWEHADAELQPTVRAARARMAQLGAPPRPPGSR